MAAAVTFPAAATIAMSTSSSIMRSASPKPGRVAFFGQAADYVGSGHF